MSKWGDVCNAASGTICNIGRDFDRSRGVALNLQTHSFETGISASSPTAQPT